MLIPLHEFLKKYPIELTGVIQVGCHFSEEHNDFVEAGIKKFIYIEPCKNAIEVLKNKVGYLDNVKIFPVACGDVEGKAEMFVSHQNQGQSNSLLPPKGHLEQHPEIIFSDKEIVDVVLLDNLVFDRKEYNFLVMDCQGAEGMVLKGAKETLKHISVIYTECNRGETYGGNMLIEEMDAFLKEYGFIRVETYWPSVNWSWGDSCYVKENLIPNVD